MRERTAGYEVVWLVLSEPEMWDARGMTVAWLDEHGTPDLQADYARVSVIRYRMVHAAEQGPLASTWRRSPRPVVLTQTPNRDRMRAARGYIKMGDKRRFSYITIIASPLIIRSGVFTVGRNAA
jgi:hypothetical protein